jgi:capsular polysaccharide transport system permease protein
MSDFKPHFLKKINALFVLTVVLPTALAVAYFGFIASDVYTSQSSYVVRSPEKPSSGSLGGLLKGAGFSSARDESFTVQSYILSRDALKVLTDEVAIGTAYASSEVDLLNRFGGLDADNSFEALHRYYQNKVTVLTDTATSISTLTVKAFTAQDAQLANKVLLRESEASVLTPPSILACLREGYRPAWRWL